MNGRSIGMLAAAVICGLGAMIGTSRLISKGGNAPVEMRDVLVAVEDLKIEEVIKPESVKVVRMPKASVPAGAFTSPKDIQDRWVQIGILQGEPIVERKLAERGTPPGLVAKIPAGMRAFAVEVNEQSGVSGFIMPDHRVDVIQIDQGQKDGPPQAETVLQDVLVLASGQVFSRPENRSILARTVTLAVTPEQVDELVSARSRGSLSLALRGLNDHSQAPRRQPAEKEPPAPPPVAPAPEPKEVAVVPPPEPPASPAPPPPRIVWIYRWNLQGGKCSAERVSIHEAVDREPELLPADAASARVAEN